MAIDGAGTTLYAPRSARDRRKFNVTQLEANTFTPSA